MSIDIHETTCVILLVELLWNNTYANEEQSTAVKISAMKPAAMLDVEIRCTARVRMSAVPTWTQRVSEHPDSAPRGMPCAETKNRFNTV